MVSVPSGIASRLFLLSVHTEDEHFHIPEFIPWGSQVLSITKGDIYKVQMQEPEIKAESGSRTKEENRALGTESGKKKGQFASVQRSHWHLFCYSQGNPFGTIQGTQ